MLKKYNMSHTNMTLTPDTIFARRTQWQAWLDVEAALARGQRGKAVEVVATDD